MLLTHLIALLACGGLAFAGCAESGEPEDDDAGTDTDTDSDTDIDTDSDTDTDTDTDSDTDTDTDTDSDTDTDTDSDTGAPDGGAACEDAFEVPDDPPQWDFSSNWMYFQDDTFDSYLDGCSESDGTTAWFEVNVPAGYTLEVEKTSGATVGINVVESCDATECLASDINRVIWPNLSDAEVTWMVAVETDFNISAAAMDFTFDRYEKHGEACVDGIPLEGPYPQTEVVSPSDFEYDTMPTGCGQTWYTGEDVWFLIPIPPATQMTFQALGDSMWGYMFGYSLDCASCQGNYEYWTTSEFEYTNTTAETVDVHAFIQNQTTLGGNLTAIVAMEPLPDGDACVGAIDIDETALPYSWSDSSPLFIHSCPSGICPGTSGPDVWHEITVPPGDVVRVDKLAGPAAYFAAVAECTDATALFFSTNPQLLVWQNITAEPQTIHIVAGAVSTSSIATLELEFDIETPAPGDFCGSAIPVAYNDTAAKTGAWADFGDYFWGAPGCGAASGAEAWYEVAVPSGQKLTITETTPSDTTIQVLAACDAGECVESNLSEVAIYLNTTTSDHTVFVAVESATAVPTSSTYSVSFAWETPPPGDLCVDPLEILESSDSWTGSWSAYMDSSTLSTANGCGYANGRDVWFDVWVGAGERLTVVQDSPIPTMLQVVDDCGDDATCSQFGADEVTWYNDSVAAVAVTIGVEAIASSVVGGPIDLYFDREAIPAGDSCSTAFDVDEGSLPFVDEPVLWMYGPAWPNSWCSPGQGNDVWYAVDVPPGEVVFFDEQSSADTVLHLAVDCPITGCVSSADAPESINWYNATSGTVTAYAVAKAKSTADNGATLGVAIDVAPASVGDFCSSAIDLTDETLPYTWDDGDLTDFTNGFTGLESNGCSEVVGAEVWFAIDVPAGYWLNVNEDSTTPVVTQILSSCATSTCLDTGGESLFWHNEGSSAVTVYVAIEGNGVSYGALDVTFDVIDAPPTMFGPTTESAGYWGATDDEISACPDIKSTGTDLGLTDDDVVPVTMGIDFEFFGDTWSSVWVNSNGQLSFGTEAVWDLSGTIPSLWYDQPIIAVYWDDLNPSSDGAVYTQTIGDTFVVQWNVPPFGSMTPGLYDVIAVLDGGSGMIHFCYVDTEIGDSYSDLGVYAASGIQGSSSEYLAYSNQEPVLVSGLHVWFVAP